MKINNKSYQNGFIKLKNKEWADKQRVAGKITAATLNLLKKEMLNHSLLKLNNIAEEFIYDNKCIPTFKNYKNFPFGVCMSLNKTLVHGYPTDYFLQENDIISFDLGCTFEKIVADSALTISVDPNKNQKLLIATEEALANAIKSIKINKQLGIIGQSIFNTSKKYNLSVIDSYGGHGICNDSNGLEQPHALPFVSNKDIDTNGIRFAAGLSIAIEPLFCLGTNKTKILNNGWDVVCDNLCAHFEHTIFLHEDHIEIMTFRENENYLTNSKVYYK